MVATSDESEAVKQCINGTNSGNLVNGNVEKANAYSQPVNSISGVLHYLQYEWAKFELDRSKWEVEKAELEAKIAFLKGERQGQDNLKNDLIRRIKMLEFALRKERNRYNSLKYGNDNEIEPENYSDDGLSDNVSDNEIPAVDNNSALTLGRQMLRDYLNEIGYTDNIIDVRSRNVKSILGLGSSTTDHKNHTANQSNELLSQLSNQQAINNMTENLLNESEQAVISSFDFLSDGSVCEEQEEGGDQIKIPDDVYTQREARMPVDSLSHADYSQQTSSGAGQHSMSQKFADIGTALTCDMSSAFGLSATDDLFAGINLRDLDQAPIERSPYSDADTIDGSVSATNVQCAANDARSLRYKTWSPKYTLRSHFDSVRCVLFHPTASALFSASDDHTVKLWNLNRTVSPRKSAQLVDVEPVYTFRAHSAPVLCVRLSACGRYLFSADLEGCLCVWRVPSPNVDPYDAYCPEVLCDTVHAHTDAVWSLDVCRAPSGGEKCHALVLSCSADGDVKLWRATECEQDTQAPLTVRLHQVALLSSPELRAQRHALYDRSLASAAPSSVCFVGVERCTECVVGYTNGRVCVCDLRAGEVLVWMKPAPVAGGGEAGEALSPVTCVLYHQTLALVVTSGDDGCLRLYDRRTGTQTACVHAHRAALGCVAALDSSGLYIVSAGHDARLCVWAIEADGCRCVQEIECGDDSGKNSQYLHSVCLHTQCTLMATAAADSVVNVYV